MEVNKKGVWPGIITSGTSSATRNGDWLIDDTAFLSVFFFFFLNFFLSFFLVIFSSCFWGMNHFY